MADRDERTPLVTYSLSSAFGENREISRTQIRISCICILLVVALERLAFYGITCNLVMFLNADPFMWQALTGAAWATFAFYSLSFLSSLVFGILADSLFGRFSTLAISFVLFVIGSALMCVLGYFAINIPVYQRICVGTNHTNWMNVTSITPTSDSTVPQTPCTSIIFFALFLIALGAGSIRSNLSPFGAEQVKDGGPDVMHTFFNWFYWAINVGSLVAFSAVAFIQQNINFYVGFFIPFVAVCLCLAIFLFGRISFITRRATGSVLWNTFRIIWQAFRRRSLRLRSYQRNSGIMMGLGPQPGFMDMAKLRYGGSFHDNMVEDVKALGKVIVVFLALVPYWMVYYQMQTTFIVQGLHLKITRTNITKPQKMDSKPSELSKIPVAWLSLFNIVAVLILLPLMDRVLFPWLERHGRQISLLRRMLIGMLFSILAIMAAGILEVFRLNCYKNVTDCKWVQNISNTLYYSANLSVMYQIPQYTLIGISEVFASVAGLEFAYSQAPRSMQGLIMGLFCISNGIGAVLGGALLNVGECLGWLNRKDHGNINRGHLAYYFFLLCGIQFVGTLLFCLVVRNYERPASENSIQDDPSRSGRSQPRTPWRSKNT